MEIFSIKGIHVDGVVACVPEQKIDNETSLREMYGDEAKLIMESTGIRTRYIAAPGLPVRISALYVLKSLWKGQVRRRKKSAGWFLSHSRRIV